MFVDFEDAFTGYQFVDVKLVLNLWNVIRNVKPRGEIHTVDHITSDGGWGVGATLVRKNLTPHLLLESGALNENFHKTFKDLSLVINLSTLNWF